MYKNLDINENVKINESSSVFYILFPLITLYIISCLLNKIDIRTGWEKITYLHAYQLGKKIMDI